MNLNLKNIKDFYDANEPIAYGIDEREEHTAWQVGDSIIAVEKDIDIGFSLLIYENLEEYLDAIKGTYVKYHAQTRKDNMSKEYVDFHDDYISIRNKAEEIVGWSKDEWVEDPEVVFSIANAVRIAYGEPNETVEEMINEL